MSRWRKLGQRLGLARRLPWESPPRWGSLEVGLSSKLKTVSRSATGGRPVPSPSSYEGLRDHAFRRFLAECRGFAIDVILDIGANSGQFAQGLRADGYRGQIVSFEPLPQAHAVLAAVAVSDPLWDVAERCAVGASDGSAEINVAGNSYRSSLLPVLNPRWDAGPQSPYQGKEQCSMVTLDTFIERTFTDPTTLFGLKIDTRRYETEVLAGLKLYRDKVKVIICEMSLGPAHEGGSSMPELCAQLARQGFRCVALEPEFEDCQSGEFQVKGVFVRRH
jgi:FkbM family methyltransferase